MAYRKESKRRTISKRRILILCEGKTEKIYLEGLRNSLPRKVMHDVDLEIAQAKHGEPVSAVKEIVRKKKKARSEKQSYSEAWLVFDDDNRELHTLFQKLDQSNIKFAYSSIAIEFWFLLHYGYTHRQYANGNAVIAELEKHYGKYRKTDTKLWTKLEPGFAKASKNASRLADKHIKDNVVLPNCKPYSNMNVLVDRLKNLAVG